MTKTMLFFCLFILSSSNLFSQQNDFQKLTGSYLGQKLPGMTPELFAPGILSTVAHEHSSPSFSPGGKEVYYSVIYPGTRLEVIMFRKVEGGIWSEPEVAPFSGRFREGGPVFSRYGSKLFYYSMRPLIEGEKPSQMDLWYVERKEDSWSNPQNLGPKVNSTNMEMTLSVAENGNLYFSVKDSINDHTLYVAEYINGSYTKARSCGKLVESNYTEWCPYIAPDESYMIFAGYKTGGKEDNDLYIVFKEDDGSWSDAVNMGESINTEYQEQFPRVSNDGKYLFFTSNRLNINRRFSNYYSYDEPLTYKKIQNIMNEPGNGRSDIYWVDAKIIEELRPKE